MPAAHIDDESVGVQAHIQSGSRNLREGLKTVLALVHKAQLPVTRKMRALLVEGSLLEDDLQAHTAHACCCACASQRTWCLSQLSCQRQSSRHAKGYMRTCHLLQYEQAVLALQGALRYFHTLRPAGRMATSVPDDVLDDLLYKLSAANMPAELLRTIMLMKSDFMRLPPVSTDSSGRSFLTLWLATRHLSAPPAAPEPGFEGGSALLHPALLYQCRTCNRATND